MAKMKAWKKEVVLFYAFYQVLVVLSEPLSNLKLAVIFFRHGDRTPIHLIPNDKNREDEWPEGLGQLTTTGIAQQYANGQYFRRKYDGFINQTYHHNQIYVRSTDVDRTLMSAQAMLAGLYHPPHGDQMWRNDLPWMPIPVHTEPTSQDYVYKSSGGLSGQALKHYCPLAGSQEVDESEEKKAFLLLHQVFIKDLCSKAGMSFYNSSTIYRIHDTLICEETLDYLKNHTAEENSTAPDASRIHDTLLCEKYHGKTWPEWVSDDLYNKLDKEIVPGLQAFDLNKSDIKNFNRGTLVYEVARLFRMKFNNTLDPDLRTFFYSAHDTTILAILGSLDLYNSNKQVIPYCTTIMLELYHNDIKGWFVQMHFKNSTATDAVTHQLTIPGCIDDCPLTKFLNITNFYSHENWEKKCLAPRVFRVESLKEITIISVTSGVALLFLALCLAFTCHKACSRKRRRTRTYGRIRVRELVRPEEVPMISSNSIGSDLDE